MNERIRKLFSKSCWDEQAEVDIEDFISVEKFAELIVKECCDQLVNEGELWEQFAGNPPSGQEQTAGAALFAAYRLKEDAVHTLKEHFGVE